MMMIGGGRAKSSEDMGRGGYQQQQQPGVGGGYHRPVAGYEASPVYSDDRTRALMLSGSRPDAGVQRSAPQRPWNNQPVRSCYSQLKVRL